MMNIIVSNKIFFEFVCKLSDLVYDAVRKIKTRKTVESRHYGWRDVILIVKFENGKRTAFTIINDV